MQEEKSIGFQKFQIVGSFGELACLVPNEEHAGDELWNAFGHASFLEQVSRQGLVPLSAESPIDEVVLMAREFLLEQGLDKVLIAQDTKGGDSRFSMLHIVDADSATAIGCDTNLPLPLTEKVGILFCVAT